MLEDKTVVLQQSTSWSGYHSNAIFKHASFQSWCCLMQQKWNLLNSVSIGTVCSVKSYNRCSKCSISALTQTHNCFVVPLVYCLVDNTLFEISTEIGWSGVSSRYWCYGNHAAGSKPI